MLRCLSVLGLALFAWAPTMTSCALQGEGERCDLDNGVSGEDADCDDGLVCTDPSTLQHSPQASICCPADGSFTTIACTPKQGGTTAASSSSSATTTSGAGGSGGAGGAAASSVTSSSASTAGSGGSGGGAGGSGGG